MFLASGSAAGFRSSDVGVPCDGTHADPARIESMAAFFVFCLGGTFCFFTLSGGRWAITVYGPTPCDAPLCEGRGYSNVDVEMGVGVDIVCLVTGMERGKGEGGVD